MRQKRAKAYKKQMATYERNFGFRAPYQILYTADFLEAAKSFHLDPIHGINKTVNRDTTKSMITQCCIKSLYDAKSNDSIRLAKTMERRRCGHVDVPETPTACVLSCVGTRNKNRYIVATQDVELRRQLRDVPGVPLIYINRSIIILEPPGPATISVQRTREAAKLGVSESEAVVLGKRKRGTRQGIVEQPGGAINERANRDGDAEISGDDGTGSNEDDGDGEDETGRTRQGQGIMTDGTAEHTIKAKKRKGPSGPNPLSVKKAKPGPSSTPRSSSSSFPTSRRLNTSGGARAGGGEAAGTEEVRTTSARRKRRHGKKTSVLTPETDVHTPT